MRVHRVCTVAIVMSLVLAGPALAGVSPDGRGGVAYTGMTSGQSVTQASAVSPDGQGGVVYHATSSSDANTNPYLNTSSTNHTMYTTNYTGTTGGYYVNGVLYNTMNVGPMAGNQAATGLAQVTNPSQMNPAGNHYSSSSTVINARRVVANTYLKDGWQFENNGMWYLYPDGTYPVSSWRSIDGANYHFNQGGYLEVNTWIYEANGAWYYVGTMRVRMAHCCRTPGSEASFSERTVRE